MFFVGKTLRLDTMIGDADFGKTDKTFGFLHDLPWFHRRGARQ